MLQSDIWTNKESFLTNLKYLLRRSSTRHNKIGIVTKKRGKKKSFCVLESFRGEFNGVAEIRKPTCEHLINEFLIRFLLNKYLHQTASSSSSSLFVPLNFYIRKELFYEKCIAFRLFQIPKRQKLQYKACHIHTFAHINKHIWLLHYK